MQPEKKRAGRRCNAISAHVTLPFEGNLTMALIRLNPLPFNSTALGAWADAHRFAALPLAVRVLSRKRHLPPWQAIAIAELAGIGGLANDR